MKAVFTCGGTGGHINPALAVARVLLERRRTARSCLFGAEDGMEAHSGPARGLPARNAADLQLYAQPEAERHPA